ncbi:SusC/RagA family TonB-linked outer membrane protein [Bacteroidia bacterium]|nr:SusC/RagA family TonB-linked outer membrane protein [Bacteroidia bacterium]
MLAQTTSEESASKTSDQAITIRGQVTDANGNPLPGVNIRLKDSPTATATDLDGNYSIPVVLPHQVLVFSYIGYASQEIHASKSKLLSQVVLQEDVHELEETVVVGYSTRTREKLINTVGTVNGEQLIKATVPNLENAISGRVSGVFSRQTSGEPGNDGADLKIRGFGSALVVVDGIPGRNYSNLAPHEIESISVLKDASAAAVYGMQGANGVILVTTKRGNKNKKAVLDISSSFGVQTPYNYPDAASADLWQGLVKEYYANEKIIANPQAVSTPQEMATTPNAYNTNWYNEMFKNAPISQTNVSISGGSEKINYFISGGYLYQDGIWTTNSTDKHRINFRSNLDIDVLDELKLSVGVGAIVNNTGYSAVGSDAIARSLKFAAPNIPVRWNESREKYAFGGEGTDNPMALADKNAAGYRDIQARDLNVDFGIEYKIPVVTGLSLKANVGYTQVDGWNKTWSKTIDYIGFRAEEFYPSISASNTNKASLLLNDNKSYSLVGQGFINYLNSFGKHNINSSVIFEINQAESRWFYTSRGEFPSSVLDMMSGGLSGKLLSNGESLRVYRSASIIGRFSYDYSSRYFADFNFRYDGAQYFADKWGFFPSVVAGWMVSKEGFMESIQPVLNELKLKVSYGELGDLSAAKSYYDDNEQYYFQSGYLYPGSTLIFGDRTLYGLAETKNANPDFTWSTSSIVNAGMDFKMWKGLLSGAFDVFYRQRKGLPAQKANDNAGALATYYNLNNDNTRGFEVSLGHKNSINKFVYSIDANLSWSRSQYGYLEHGQYTSGYDEWKWNNGYQWTNVRWGLNQIGQYQSYDEIANAPMHSESNYNGVILPGDLKYEDWNGDGYIDDNDRRPIGRTAYPEMMYGFNVNMEWKGFDFSMFWQGGALSNFQISAFDMAAFQEGETFNNTWAYFEDSWRKSDYTNPDAAWIQGHFPAVRDMFTPNINTGMASTFWMWNGNYLRLKNIEVGYTLPTNVAQKMFIKSLRIYVSAYNLFTLSAQKYFDPEQPEAQYSFASYPQLKSYNIGINLKF